ncbi:hypothetical protein KAK06_16520 [Ideonella sp. 4Y11]|uniref:Uncharacterized protein n=1 Tax=Ideonella aquatica TaxID=2824119 RepID=A0A940YI65_9BURK|nr:hypothetical protein [Ideonella aquatica]MBQ0960560.1 hypothetical protein [Ideonella aquatica]
MTHPQHSDTPDGSFRTITYSVVPLVTPDDAVMQRCAYFHVQAQKWQPVAPQDLASAYGSDFVCLEQPRARDVPDGVLGEGRYDHEATLFAAVAKTLSSSKGLPNTFLASELGGRPRVVMPVAPGSTRGVILLFVRHRGDQVLGLVPTRDPEIKGTL